MTPTEPAQVPQHGPTEKDFRKAAVKELLKEAGYMIVTVGLFLGAVGLVLRYIPYLLIERFGFSEPMVVGGYVLLFILAIGAFAMDYSIDGRAEILRKEHERNSK